MRRLSLLDHALEQADRALRTLVPGASRAQRPAPAASSSPLAGQPALSAEQRRHSAGLMRINHCGEVCAQALYQGQAMTAKLEQVREQMQRAADEERDHLAWCEQRLRELDSRASLLNPVFYSLSLALGAAAGMAGDRWSLGFIAATEQQVCQHLQAHLDGLADTDPQSSAILQQMLDEEQRHGEDALAAGGAELPAPLQRLMPRLADLMRRSTYYV